MPKRLPQCIQVVVVIAVVTISGCDPPPPAPELIKASFGYIGGSILFQNKEPFALHDCEFELEAGGDTYIFKWSFVIAPQEEAPLLDASGFTTSAGKVLNTAEWKPKTVSVECSGPDQKHYGGMKDIP